MMKHFILSLFMLILGMGIGSAQTATQNYDALFQEFLHQNEDLQASIPKTNELVKTIVPIFLSYGIEDEKATAWAQEFCQTIMDSIHNDIKASFKAHVDAATLQKVIEQQKDPKLQACFQICQQSFLELSKELQNKMPQLLASSENTPVTLKAEIPAPYLTEIKTLLKNYKINSTLALGEEQVIKLLIDKVKPDAATAKKVTEMLHQKFSLVHRLWPIMTANQLYGKLSIENLQLLNHYISQPEWQSCINARILSMKKLIPLSMNITSSAMEWVTAKKQAQP